MIPFPYIILYNNQTTATTIKRMAISHWAIADPTYHIYQEWCNGTAVVRAELLQNQTDLTGVLYWNKDLEFQVVSMIADPVECSQRDD